MSHHEEHIIEHLKQVLETRGPKVIERIEEINGFKFNGALIRRPTGGRFTVDDCRAYLLSIREILGETSASFAKVRFLLAGCLGTDALD